MTLGRLNAAIDAAPDVFILFSFGSVPVKKGALKETLRAHFKGQRGAETGLTITPGHFLQWETRRASL